jgi:hypothetical protein
MTIANLQKWIDRDIPRSKCDVVYAAGEVGGYEKYKFFIYTDNNKYAIYADETPTEYLPKGYLGCVAQSRKYRPGEDWFRGNDLPDGPLTEKTWNVIMKAIVRYELQDVVKRDHRKNHADTCIGPVVDLTPCFGDHECDVK